MKKIIIVIFANLILSFFLAANTKSFASSSFVKYSNNPLIGNSFTPSVLYENGSFLMWFSSQNAIGMATSADGLSWSLSPENPVLVPNLNDPNEQQVLSPTVIKDGQLYKMWYQTVSANQSFNINYATSTDGVHWNKVGPVNLPIQGWEFGSHTDPYVLKNNSGFLMWFTSNDGHWKISYATSSDGINWTSHPLNPVLSASEAWEGTNVVAPTVIFDGNLFEMWYHTDFNISYAQSTDGINWTKIPQKNPAILKGINTEWDSIIVAAPSVQRIENGSLYLYYSALGPQGIPNIGLAIDEPVVTPSPTATPTPSPTPSPTATPTPTNTPTPTPLLPTPTPRPVTKVIVIPGFGGSLNEDALIHCKTDSYDGGWHQWNLLGSAYTNLVSSLQQNGFETLTYYYDWRKQPPELANGLKNFITVNATNGEKVHVVAHSMGGQVARAYVEQEKDNSRIDKLMTVGTPHQGVAFTYPIWSAAEVINPIPNIFWKTALAVELLACRLSGQTGTDKQILQRVIPSIQTFLPTFDYLIDQKTKQFKSLDSLNAKNPWLLHNQLFQPPYYGVYVSTLSGSGFSTLKTITVKNPSLTDLFLGNWLDGKPVGYSYDSKGDGLVLNISSKLPQVTNRVVAGTHGDIVTEPTGVSEILSFITGQLQPLQALRLSTPETEPKNIVAILSTDTTFETNGGGKKTGKHQLELLIDPIDGEYTIDFSSQPNGSLTVLQISEKTVLQTKRYELKNIRKKQMRLRINKKNPLTDPISY